VTSFFSVFRLTKMATRESKFQSFCNKSHILLVLNFWRIRNCWFLKSAQNIYFHLSCLSRIQHLLPGECRFVWKSKFLIISVLRTGKYSICQRSKFAPVLFQSPDHIKVWGSADRDRSLLNPALDEGWCSALQTDSYNLLPFPEEETYIAYLMGG